METMMKNLEKNDMMVGVNAIIFNSRNELLLSKRKNCLGDGLYSLVGGHLKKGESIEECIIRELFEEIGIIVDINDVEVVNFAFVAVGVPMIEIGVYISKYQGEPFNKEQYYSSDIKFFKLNELPEIFRATKANIDLFLKNKFYDSDANVYVGSKK